MGVDAKSIKELRDKTGMGMTDCKKALVEANGSVEEAEMLLRKKGIDKAAKKADRATGEGIIRADIRDNVAVMLEMGCEQEPTTGNERFLAFADIVMDLAFSTGAKDVTEIMSQNAPSGASLEEELKSVIGTLGENIQVKRIARMENDGSSVIGNYVHFNNKAGALCTIKMTGGDAANADLQTVANDVCMHSVATRPLALNRDGISADFVAKETELFMDEIKTKPENIQEKILTGKLNKLYSEKCLTEQIFVKDPDGKNAVGKVVAEAAKAAGGEGEITEWVRFELGL